MLDTKNNRLSRGKGVSRLWERIEQDTIAQKRSCGPTCGYLITGRKDPTVYVTSSSTAFFTGSIEMLVG